MATYKKKSSNPKKSVEEKSTTAGVFDSLDQGANKTEAWIAKNQNIIYGALAVIAIAVLGFFGYQKFIKAPTEAEAATEMAQAQLYFSQALSTPTPAAQDSLFSTALKGNNTYFGFLDITENYSGTPAANLAQYYAGMAYLRMGEYKEAISHLDKFESEDEFLAPLAVGAIGDAFTELEQLEDALGYYEKAASMRSNSFTTPKFLLKAAQVAVDLGKADVAKNHLKKLKTEYPNSREAQRAEVLLGIAKTMK